MMDGQSRKRCLKATMSDAPEALGCQIASKQAVMQMPQFKKCTSDLCIQPRKPYE